MVGAQIDLSLPCFEVDEERAQYSLLLNGLPSTHEGHVPIGPSDKKTFISLLL